MLFYKQSLAASNAQWSRRGLGGRPACGC